MLVSIFFPIDEFCKQLRKHELKALTDKPSTKRGRQSKLKLSEIMTIMVYYPHSGYKTFKDYYCKYVKVSLTREFPRLGSYNRFTELMRQALVMVQYI